MYPPLKRSLVSALCAALPALAAHAQTTPAPDPSSTATLPAVTVNATPGSAAADVSGFGDVPLRELPMAVTVVGQQVIPGYDTAALDKSLAPLGYDVF